MAPTDYALSTWRAVRCWREGERSPCVGPITAVQMLDADLDAAARRFSKDHGARQQQEAARRKQLRAEREAQRARQAAHDAEVARREDERARVLAVEAAQRDEDLERNDGVAYAARLRPIFSTAAEARGIARRDDKIQLPRSAQTALAEQSAERHGQLFFEVRSIPSHYGVTRLGVTTLSRRKSTRRRRAAAGSAMLRALQVRELASNRATHAAILDYEAAEGTLGAPLPVLQALGLAPQPAAAKPSDAAGGDGGASLTGVTPSAATVSVRYRRLPRGTFARVQPRLASFFDGSEEIKEMLERELQALDYFMPRHPCYQYHSLIDTCVNHPLLQRRATLSEGDEVRVTGADGAAHTLRILELRPAPAVTLIDTDLEVEVSA